MGKKMMHLRIWLLAALMPAFSAFVATPSPHLPGPASSSSTRSIDIQMGPAKDGPFTPAVLAAKVILGEKQLLKLRGKAISYHSQYINEFCSECNATAPVPSPTPLDFACLRNCDLWSTSSHHFAHSRRIIMLHFLLAVGVPKKMNQALIKKAKAVGSDLGFL